MTTIYFIRHAQSDSHIKQDDIRPLTEKGLKDRELVTGFLSDKNIQVALSSPYKRAVDTISDFTEKNNLTIQTINGFRERKVDNAWIEDFWGYVERQWRDFDYKFSDGECLNEVRERNINALEKVLDEHSGKNIVIGTHGSALSQIIHHYDNRYSHADFMKMVNIMPWVVKMDFVGRECVLMTKIDLYNLGETEKNIEVNVFNEGSFESYRYVVIFASYQGKMLYCRNKNLQVYETAGGKIEDGETPLEAAKRELFEETGATDFSIIPILDYKAQSDMGFAVGKIFFAEINELGEIPEEFEMEEVKLFDTIPDKMRFPQILPVLYEKFQVWRVMQNSKGELWDVYDENRNLTGRVHRRGTFLAPNDYHLVVQVWIRNSEGKFLVSQRCEKKGFPFVWETTGGSALTGDDSLSAALREVKEELGVDLLPENGKCIYSFIRGDSILDVWFFNQDIDLSEVVLDENETMDAKYMTSSEIMDMISKEKFFQYSYVDEFFDSFKK